MFASEELSDIELTELLEMWIVPDPPASLRERIFPSAPKRPVYPREIIWGAYRGSEAKSIGASLLMHAAAVALLFLLVQSGTVQKKLRDSAAIVYLPQWRPKLPAAAHKAGGGGGGGQKAPEPVSKGAAPSVAPKQFVPPAQAIPEPKLPAVPTITAQAPQITADLYGDPLSKILVNSGGPGANGLGSGTGGGTGPGNGDGYGPGLGGGLGGGIYRIGGDVSQPLLIYKVEPEYSEQARRAKYSGTVLLSVIIDANGNPRDIHVIRPLGLGLDEKAIQAVSKWRFRPAEKGGRPVAVEAQVEVNFRLL